MAQPNSDTAPGHHLAIMIPAYNEAETIGEVIRQMPSDLAGIAAVTVIVIDDGSTDATAERAAAEGARVVSHHRNMGIAATFRTAVKSCLEVGADLAVSIDADLQFDPVEIPKLIGPILDEEVDFVAGDRFSGKDRPKDMPRVKYHGNQLMTRVVSLITGTRFRDVSSGYRAYSREALLNLNVQSSFTYTQESFIELAGKGLAICQVPVTVRYYPERRSRVVSSVLRYALRTFLTIARTTRDYAPLTVFGGASLPLIIPGILLGLFVIAHYIVAGSFSPYIFLAFAAVYLFTAGAALFVLGLVADMLRGIRNNQERLLYFAKRTEYGRSANNDS